MPYFLLLFIGMPILELFLLINVGSAIGVFPTIGIVILTAVIGTFMLKAQGLSTLNKARSRMSGGQVPAFEMMEGLALGVGGALLLTPGFVTDAFGFICLIPFTRRWLVRKMSSRVSVGSVVGGFSSGMPPSGAAGHGAGQRHASGSVENSNSSAGSKSATSGGKVKPKTDGDVIEGEYIPKD